MSCDTAMLIRGVKAFREKYIIGVRRNNSTPFLDHI
jgi:hypothetical protein